MADTKVKEIDTIVEDIYEVMLDPKIKPTPEAVHGLGEDISRTIAARLVEEGGKPGLRMSNIGNPCSRQLYYKVHNSGEGEELDAPTLIKFMIGDILEHVLIFLCKVAGHKVEGTQDTLVVEGIKGHRDLVLDGMTTDAKSASSFSFNKFESGKLEDDDAFGYIDQLGGYVTAGDTDPLVTEKGQGAFLVIDKTLGKICLDRHGYDTDEVKSRYIERTAEINSDEVPGRAFEPVADGKSGNMKLPPNCSYCAFKHKCWPDLRTFIYSTGPRYLTTVAKLPNVPEVDINGDIVMNMEEYENV